MSNEQMCAAVAGTAAAAGPYVCIYASQVAMCIGANRHKKIGQALELMWQRVSPASFQAALRRNRMRTADEIAEHIIATNPRVRDLVDRTLDAEDCDSSDQVASRYDSVVQELRTVRLPEDDKKLVDEVLKRNLYTGYGNKQEHHVLDYVRSTLGIPAREDPVFYKQQQGVCEGPWGSFPWYVGGKIDAIDEHRKLLIEIKNRVNRLFYRVPFYEQVQVQAYLELLDLEEGILVECLKTKHGTRPHHTSVELPDRLIPMGDMHTRRSEHATNTPQQQQRARSEDGDGPPGADPAPAADPAAPDTVVNVIPIRRDRELWHNEIVPKLREFVAFLARIIYDINLQDRYLQSRRRNALVVEHVNAALQGRPKYPRDQT
jgi:hypothetical protein